MKVVEPTGRLRRKVTSVEEAEQYIGQTESIIETAFMASLGSPGSIPVPQEGQEEQEGQPVIPRAPISRMASAEADNDPSLYERAMITLMGVRDKLADAFRATSHDKLSAKAFCDSISKIEASLKELGAEVDPFNPLAQITGLGQEDELRNAKMVVENTQKHYKLYPIKAITAEMTRKGPSIRLSLDAESAGKKFTVTGLITAQADFSGNEAVDFVTEGGEGMMSVKAMSRGKWADVSSDFSIDWSASSDQKPVTPVS